MGEVRERKREERSVGVRSKGKQGRGSKGGEDVSWELEGNRTCSISHQKLDGGKCSGMRFGHRIITYPFIPPHTTYHTPHLTLASQRM